MTLLESLSTPDIIYDPVLELLLLDFKNKQIKTNSSDLRHSIIEIPPHTTCGGDDDLGNSDYSDGNGDRYGDNDDDGDCNGDGGDEDVDDEENDNEDDDQGQGGKDGGDDDVDNEDEDGDDDDDGMMGWRDQATHSVCSGPG